MWIPLGLIGTFLLIQSSSAGGPIPQEEFDARKQEMIQQDRLMWAWLENCDKNFNHYNDLIWTRFIEVWQYKYAERSKRQAQPLMARARYQYEQCFTPNQIEQIDTFFRGQYSTGMHGVPSPWVANASANQQMNAMSVMYLVGEQNRDYTSFYDGEHASWLFTDFCYQDRCYSFGNTYNTYEFARDWLYWTMDRYVDWNSYQEGMQEYPWEMDSRNYFVSQFKPLQMLRDLAANEEMARKADMLFTLLILNAKMDFSAGQWGGALGRNYPYQISDNFSIDFNWGMFGDWTAYKHTWANPGDSWTYAMHYDEQAVSLVNIKPYDPLLMEIGNVDWEADDYYHIHIEKNSDHTNWNWVGEEPNTIRDSANWNYVTKYYNLGGNRNQWALQIRPHSYDPYGGEKNWAFRFWTDDDYCTDENGEPLESCDDDENATHYMGGANIQYKNAIFILNSARRQVMAPDFYIESTENIGGWSFYRIETGDEINEGQPVEVVVAFKDNNQALEVCTVGVDYPSYEAFRDAILTNAWVDQNGFTTSKGDVISRDGVHDYGLINGEPIWGEYGFPIPDFPLITTYDQFGNKMISWDWDTKVLTLNHNGQSKSYDFKNWSMTGYVPPQCSGDVNEDGTKDISDLQELINQMDQGSSGDYCLDINADQEVNGWDVQSLVEKLLSGN